MMNRPQGPILLSRAVQENQLENDTYCTCGKTTNTHDSTVRTCSFLNTYMYYCTHIVKQPTEVMLQMCY